MNINQRLLVWRINEVLHTSSELNLLKGCEEKKFKSYVKKKKNTEREKQWDSMHAVI